MVPEGAVPPYLLDREGQSRAKVLSNMIKQKRKEKAVSYLFCLGASQTFHGVCHGLQGKWTVPLPKVKAVGEDEVFKVLRTGKRRSECFPELWQNFSTFVTFFLCLLLAEKSWKRMVTKVTYVGEGFTRKPPKYERFIRPMALRFKKAHVTHPEV